VPSDLTNEVPKKLQGFEDSIIYEKKIDIKINKKILNYYKIDNQKK
jgi:hypothetical protein